MEIVVYNQAIEKIGYLKEHIKASFCEKFQGVSDFLITVPYTKENTEMLEPMNFIYYDNQLYLIEKVKADGKTLLASGRNILLFMFDTNIDNYSREAIPTKIIYDLASMARFPSIIRFRQIFNDREQDEAVSVELMNTNVLKEIQNVCLLYDCGFKTSFSPNTRIFNFDSSYPRDCTVEQNDNKKIIFSDKLFNYTDFSYTLDTHNYKNVANVFALTDSGVFSRRIDLSGEEFKRVINVNLTGKVILPQQNYMFSYYGRQALKRCRKKKIFKITPSINSEYLLGDKCTLVNSKIISGKESCIITEKQTVFENGIKKVSIILEA